MATPTRAAIYSQIQAVVDCLESTRLFGRVNSKNVISLINSIQTISAGDYVVDVENALQTFRANQAANVSPSVAAALLRPFLQTLCKSVIGRGDTSSDASMNFEIYKYFVDNAQRVQSRGITYGIPVAAGANYGNGQIIRLIRDQYNFNAENVYLDSKRLMCVADYQTGTARGQEVFQLVGQTPARDDLERSGSGAAATITGRTTDDSLLFNASFDNFSGTATVPTAVTNWTVTDLAGNAVTFSSTYATFDGTNYFRQAPSGATPYALKLASSCRFTQAMSVRGTKFRADRPYLLAVIWNSQVNSAQGTLVVRLGNTNRSVSVTGATGWNVTLIPVTAGSFAQQSCWPRLFETDNMSLSFDWTQTASGLLIDDVLLCEGQPADGCFFWPYPASATSWKPSKYLDQYSFADFATSDSKVNKWLWIAFNAYWPHSLGSSVTLSDP